MSKRIQDFKIVNKASAGGNCLLTLLPLGTPDLHDITPGQFVQVQALAPEVLLRRPISVCDVTPDGHLILMVKPIGNATRHIDSLAVGDTLNLVLPLGNGFDTSDMQGRRALLVGGGVGVAPLVFLARALTAAGAAVDICIGGRSAADIAGIDSLFVPDAHLHFATDDGSAGHHGLVTSLNAFSADYHRIYCCGPTPMMKAVAASARSRGIDCFVSLENMMACGLGACLCCIEKTVRGNICVCTEGPVFNINQLLWN